MMPWTVARQAPLSMEVSRQEYSSELPFPSPGDLPNPGIKLTSPKPVGGFFTTESHGKPMHWTSALSKPRLCGLPDPPSQEVH